MRSKGAQQGNRLFLHDIRGVVADEDDTPTDGKTSIQMKTVLAWQICQNVQQFNGEIFNKGNHQKSRHMAITQFQTEFKDEELMTEIFSDISYDVSCMAKEFVFGHVRRMTGEAPVDLYYLNDTRNRGSAVLGQSFKSNGIRFTTKPEHLQGVLASTMQRLNHLHGASDRLQAMTHLLMEGALRPRLNIFSNWFDKTLTQHSRRLVRRIQRDWCC